VPTRWLGALLLTTALALTACGCRASRDDANRNKRAQAPTTVAATVVSTPPLLLRRCRSQALLAPACPHRLPRASNYSARRIGRGGLALKTFDIESGVPYADPARNAPPSFVHVVVEAGNLRDSLGSFVFPTKGMPAAPVDGLTRSKQRDRLVHRVPEAVFLGRITWGDTTGIVALAPPYNAVSSIHGDHLMFRWRRGETEYVLSLHAWEPFSECFLTLRAMVESLDGQ
jgi:hypothetical protein